MEDFRIFVEQHIEQLSNLFGETPFVLKLKRQYEVMLENFEQEKTANDEYIKTLTKSLHFYTEMYPRAIGALLSLGELGQREAQTWGLTDLSKKNEKIL